MSDAALGGPSPSRIPVRRFAWARNAARLAAAVVLSAAAGCSRNDLNLAPVEGVVLLDGAPVGDAGVTFAPVDAKQGPPAFAATDEQGRFTLVTANRPGAVLGEHRVAISKSESIAIPQSRGLPLYRTNELVPPKYGSVETSGLTRKVEDDDNEFEFELTSQ